MESGERMSPRVLVVDDDDTIRTSLGDALATGEFEVAVASSAEEALTHFRPEGAPDLVLSDVKMPGLDGIELLRLLKERAPTTDVILMTAFDDMPTVVTAMREGAADFLSKPLNLQELRRILRQVSQDRRTREAARRQTEEAAVPYQLNQLVGRDPKMIGIYKLVGQLAANRANVLVRGETGTGKELIARAIHFNSADAAEPFVPVNCTAIPESLLESELFGHVRGAFTGAISDRRGRFSLAGRGAIFLDEIGDTSPAFQTKLLRVLENHEFCPVGGERTERTEARVIAATHRDLEARTAAGEFRQDLYFRLRVVEIRVPPLRERVSDIPLLAHHLLHRAAEDLHRNPPVIADDAMEVMLRHPWPGNVRELENTITMALVLTTQDVIRAEHVAAIAETAELPGNLESLEELERKHVIRVLQATRGNKTRAADILGVSRPRLRRILERQGRNDG